MHGHTFTHTRCTTCGFEIVPIWEVFWRSHWHMEPAVHTNTSVTGDIDLICPHLPSFHSFRNAVKMSLKHFVLTIENRQLHARVQRNISHSVNGTTGSYGGGWRNVEFKYGWCHCIKPVSANQLCAWKEWETCRYNRHVYAQVFQNPPALIFSEGWVLKKRRLCLGLLIIPIIPLSLHRYIPLENDFLCSCSFFPVEMTCSTGQQHILCCGIHWCPYQAS